MLLTIRTTHQPATDLGFLLHKHPDHVHTREFSCRLFTVTLRAQRRLSELLTHLYVLVPVLDDQKHYWVGDDEVEKLIRRGAGSRGLLQPAIKCRGREYLRIIYGPEYTLPEHLSRLRERGLSAKRSLALREFALGIEALERFVQKEPLRRVHECVFGVLALESEPVDPRL